MWNRLWYVCLPIAFFMPLFPIVVPAFIALYAVLVIVGYFRKPFAIGDRITHYTVFWGLAYFAVCLLAMVNTANTEAGFDILETKLSFLAFPLIAALHPNLDKVKPKWILLAFVLGCTVSVTYALGNSLYNQVTVYLETDYLHWGYYFGNYFVHTLHKGYFGLYMALGSLFALYLAILERKNRKWRNVYYALVLLLATCTILSTSKGAMAAIGISLAGMLVLGLRRFNKRQLYFSIGFALFIGLTFLFLLPGNSSVKRIQQSYTAVTQVWDGGIELQDSSSTMLRFQAWDASGALIAQNPVVGLGLGDARGELQEEYARREYVHARSRNMDAHSQILQSGLQFGIFGMAAFVLVLLMPMVYLLRSRENTKFLFLLAFFVFSLFETLFERASGCMAFTLVMFIISVIALSGKSLRES